MDSIAEFDQLGRSKFLKKYGFGRAQSYFLVYKGKQYDSKAIVGAAHGYQFGAPLKPDDFSGGEKTVAKKLKELGYKVIDNKTTKSLSSIKDLAPGSEIDNRDLMKLFQVGMMGGMRRSNIKRHLVLISDPTKGLYQDRWCGNILHYTGMGKKGDQEFKSQNRTLRGSKALGLTVYLFEVLIKTKYTYHGEVELVQNPYKEVQFDESSELRKVIMFPLRLTAKGYDPLPQQSDVLSIEKLRQKALSKLSLNKLRKRAKLSPKIPPRRQVKADQIVRNDYVVAYVKAAAKGKCDLCSQKAPFKNKDNLPFLECHHVKPLAKGGEDTYSNAVALCPNCHRKMHALNLSKDKKRLQTRILRRESKYKS